MIFINKEFEKYKDIFKNIIKNFDKSGEIIFKERNTLRKISNSELGNLAVKSFKIPNKLNSYIYTNIRKSKAYRSYHHAEFLISKNINTPRPLAFFEEKKNNRLVRSFYFSEYYEYDFTFRELITDKDRFIDWEFILEKFCDFVFHIHENNVYFKDLSPGNVLIKKINSGYEFYLIDLNRMSFSTLNTQQRLTNFIRLSLTDEMIPIIGSKYAKLINHNPKEIIDQLVIKNKKYIKKKERKDKIKKIIGKK